MEATIQQQDNRIFNIVMAVVAAILLLCAAMAWRNAGYRATVIESATMQWTSDTSWTGGW
jgi:hypothetical protein